MERDQKARVREQAEAWVEAAVARAEVAVVARADVPVDKGEEVVLRQDRAAIAFAPSVVKK